MYNFFRIACAVPNVFVGNPSKNAQQIISFIDKAEANGADLAVFPELCTTGYTCADLFLRAPLLKASDDAVRLITSHTAGKNVVCVVGAPLIVDSQLYNCALIIADGRICGAVPKTYIPTYGEFYEKRWFSSANDLMCDKNSTVRRIQYLSQTVPVGKDIIFTIAGDVKFGAEICEDLWATIPPSSLLALAGAEVIVNLSASNELISKRAYRTKAVVHQSSACLCAYAYASAGKCESTTDLIFSGHSLIAQNGRVTIENTKTIDSDYIIFSDIDLDIIRAERCKRKTFKDCAINSLSACATFIEAHPSHRFLSDGSLFQIRKLPFVPDSKAQRRERCSAIFDMQVEALIKRLEVTHSRPVIGISGGLDSTLTLLVCAMAAQRSGKDPSWVVGVTMPCFGTTDRTYENSLKLMDALGVTIKIIPIKDACQKHFCDIGHDENIHDVTYENSQARERTQVLMDLAGELGGLVVGTGDLSELALGWCTYNADHMSMYGVNAGVPKTLIRWLVDSVCDDALFPKATDVLSDIMDTPISPELLPPDVNGKIAQKTEDVVGPYALHDFFLFYTVRFGFSKEKIFLLAKRAFKDDFDDATISKWLDKFMWRFRTQQFKRSCLPDGVKIGSVALSPRGDWKMPSDADDFI